MRIYWQANNSRSWHVQSRPPMRMKPHFFKGVGLAVACLVAVLSVRHWWPGQTGSEDLATHVGIDLQVDVTEQTGETIDVDSSEAIAREQTPEQPEQEPEPSVIRGRIRSGESLASALGRWGISAKQVHTLASALRKEVNPRSIRPGDLFALWPHKTTGDIEEFELVRSAHLHEAPVHYRLRRQEKETGFSIARMQMPVVSHRVGLAGHVDSNLYQSVLRAGGNAGLVDQLATGIFGWQINFYRDVRPGDRFKIIADKRSTQRPCSMKEDAWQLCESFLGYGPIAAAEYVNQGNVYRGFSYRSQDGKVEGFFDENGGSLEKTFLKSPMKLTRIGSRFGRRFHPVQKRYKPHNGVDFGASRGTPFWSVADGVVLRVGFRHPSNGNYVVVQHPGGVRTFYLHASRLPKHIRPGVKVKQRQVIGYVGATGWATGPHLHFGMKRMGRNGYRYVNPLAQKFPAGKPLPAAYREEYQQHLQPLLHQLAQMDTDANEHPLPSVQTASFSRESDMVAGEGLEPPTSGL